MRKQDMRIGNTVHIYHIFVFEFGLGLEFIGQC